MMDVELKKKWVAALRSGEYKQGINYLYNARNNTFCCLGVLACVNGEKLLETSKIRFNSGHEAAAFLPVDYAGITSEIRTALMSMNDGSGHDPEHLAYRAPKTFAQIADYIESSKEI